MLVNLTPDLKEIERINSIAEVHKIKYTPQSDLCFILENGIYLDNIAFNFSKEEFLEDIEDVYIYGVADNIAQIKEYAKEYINDLNKKYIISMTPVFQDKGNKGQYDGWRWHKWGPYIGELNPQCEYLDDEDFGPDFKCVLIFNLYEILN